MILLLVVRALGELFVVGNNENGNLGISRAKANISSFTEIEIDPVQIATSLETTAILAKDGRVYTAGHNYLGSLCVSTEEVEYNDQFTPVPGLESGDVV